MRVARIVQATMLTTAALACSAMALSAAAPAVASTPPVRNCGSGDGVSHVTLRAGYKFVCDTALSVASCALVCQARRQEQVALRRVQVPDD